MYCSLVVDCGCAMDGRLVACMTRAVELADVDDDADVDVSFLRDNARPSDDFSCTRVSHN